MEQKIKKKGKGTIIVKFTLEQRNKIDRAVEKSMRTISSIVKEVVMKKVDEILMENKK